MPKTWEITIDPLDPDSVRLAIKRLERIEKWILGKYEQFMNRLAEVFRQEAQMRFDMAIVDLYENHAESVSARKAEDGVWVVEANGKDVCFIEFGAGVYYNGAEPYPGGLTNRTSEIVGIGQYGKGHGKQNGWYFNDENGGPTHYTYGTLAAKPMWFAANKVQSELTKIANEVFR